MTIPLYQKIATEIKERISSGQLEVMDKLPREADLCEEFKASRVTVRKALKVLEDESLIIRNKKGGTTITNGLDDYEFIIIFSSAPSAINQKENDWNFLSRFDTYHGILETAIAMNVPCKHHIVPQNNSLTLDQLQSCVTPGKKGAFIFASHEGYENVVNELHEKKLPYILSHTYNVPYNSVVIDYEKYSQIAVEYLFSLGHKRIALLIDENRDNWISPRYFGYVKALESQQCELDDSLIKHISREQFDTAAAISELLQLPNPPTAIFAVRDWIAFNAIEQLKKHGLVVPDEMSVIGFDNLILPGFDNFPLTTIDEKRKESGIEAAKLLSKIIRNNQNFPVKHMLTLQLAIKQSTKQAGSRICIL